MSSLVSIRINDVLFRSMKANAKRLHLTQTDYIRRAIDHMNKETEQQQRDERMKKASLLVRGESARINAEFSEIEHDPEA